jgi:collagen type III alpha
MPPSELDTTDTPRGSREETHRVGNETPARAEQPSKPEADTQRTDNRRPIAIETRTREEYADSVRSQDTPGPSGDGPRHDTDSAHQPAPASEPRDQTAAPGQAERRRETHTGDIRPPASTKNPDSAPGGDARDRTALDGPVANGSSHPDAEPAEPRSRDEYADDIRSTGAPIPSGDNPGHDAVLAEQPAGPAGEPGDQAAAPEQAEPYDRETYADEVRSPASTENPDSAPGGAHDRAATDARAGDGSREPDAEPAEPRSRDEYADVMREGQPVTATFGDAPAAGRIGTGDDRTSSETSAAEPLSEGGDAEGTPDQADERTASDHTHADSDPVAQAAEPGSRNGQDSSPSDLTDTAGRGLPGDGSSGPDGLGPAHDHLADAALSRPDQLHENELAPSQTSSGETPTRIDSPVPHRPDMAARYPADYVPSPDPPPHVDRPHEHPESWSAGINPGRDSPGRDNNCGECSRAVDSTWSGHPTAAAAMSDPDAPGEPISRMTDWASAAPASASLSEVGHRLDTLGPGSSAIVGCDWKYGGGHWFNAVNDGGSVKAIDGQSGKVENWPPSSPGLGFDESDMRYSDAILFTPDGKAAQ